MFNSKKGTYTRKILTTALDEYNQPVKSYTTSGTVTMFVGLLTENDIFINGVAINECSHIGITNSTVAVGDIINDKWEVRFINNAGREKQVFLKEVDSNGCFN